MHISACRLAVTRVFRPSFTILFIATCLNAAAQTNSWTSPTSGNWEDMSWSLGVRPGAGQTIVVGNHGWKAVAIGPNTALNFPQTMSIDSLTVISPGTDTVNTVLLNYAGLQTPLAIAHYLYVSNDTGMAILQSALQMTNGIFSVGGTVTHDVSSQVAAGDLQVLSGGTYELTNGTLFVPRSGYESVAGQFVQAGGSNFCGSLHVDGEYGLSGGQLVVPPPSGPGQGVVVFGNFVQWGGSLDSVLTVGESGVSGGVYQLIGGFLHESLLELPGNPDNGTETSSDNSNMSQTGGTNVADNMEVGQDYVGQPLQGLGSYSLSGGMLVSSGLRINGLGSFYQYGGVHSNASMTLTQSELMSTVPPYTNYFVPGNYYFNGGTFASDSFVGQSGAFSQTAGLCEITTLQMSGGQYSLSGGQLTVSNIDLSDGANFTQTGGTINQTGVITLAGVGLTVGPGSQQFGALQLSTSDNTNSVLTLSPGACVIHFANSSNTVWPSDPQLFISDWNGSLFGGGAQQIIFGSDPTGLGAQLSRVRFVDPAGVSPGIYSARILTNGEIVPYVGNISAQTNYWTSPTSGNWEDMSWSLGSPPGAGQAVYVANHGWKAVAIGPNTALNFPQTMNIDSLTITSPGTDTVNTVLLNYAGLQTPLATKTVSVGINAALVVLQSALIGQIAIAGTVIQGAMSRVTGALNIASAGAYYLTNGTLNGGFEYLSGRFRQEGGSNYCFYLGVYGGEYDLLGGDFVQDGDSYGTEIHGSFIQSGGTVSSTVAVGRSGVSGGYYELDGGILRSPYLQVPGTGGNLANDYSSMLQTGGTNVTGQLFVGANISDAGQGLVAGTGSYTLTSGMLVTTNVAINGFGSFNQTGGVHTNGSMTLTQSERFDREQPGGNSHWYFASGLYTLNGGTFVSDSINAQPGYFSQTAGSCQITTLQMGGGQYALSDGQYTLSSGQYTLSGGQLTVSNIALSGGANFTQTGGTVMQSGTLTLNDCGFTAGPGPQQFGKLLLSTNGSTNATFTLSPGASALHFATSSSLTWSNAAMLIISNWNGSLSGGGSQQIFFGGDNTGLTSQQLSQIRFGIGTNSYSAKILNTGEVVPGQVITPTVTFSQQGNNLVLTWPGGWTLQSATNVPGPYSDVTNATSPYTNDMTLKPQQFFRLRQ